jgi:aspartyl-tRNA synthetase
VIPSRLTEAVLDALKSQDPLTIKAFQYDIACNGYEIASGTTNLREISLFPMNQQAVDLLMGAPSDVTTKHLRELHIRLNLPDKG